MKAFLIIVITIIISAKYVPLLYNTITLSLTIRCIILSEFLFLH